MSQGSLEDRELVAQGEKPEQMNCEDENITIGNTISTGAGVVIHFDNLLFCL